MYLKTIPEVIQRKLGKAVWSLPGESKVYLTFDDGPSDRIEELLEILAEYHVKASFFLTGDKVAKSPGIVEKLRSLGHCVANHGQSHLDGWKCGKEVYLNNTIEGFQTTGSLLFRPPYGRMTPGQWKIISERFKVIMWSIMPGDFDQNVSPDQCLDIIRHEVKDGSIIVLHDNDQSIDKLLTILADVIAIIKEKGLEFEAFSFSS